MAKPLAVRIEGLGKRLRTRMVDLEMTPAGLIAASGLSRQTVYRALSSDEATRETAAALETALDLVGGTLLSGAPQPLPAGQPLEQAPIAPPRVAAGLPYRVRVWLQGFLLELTKGGAAEEEVEEARQLLTAPEVFTYFAGGQPKEFSEDDVLIGMQAIGDVVRATLRRRGRKV